MTRRRNTRLLFLCAATAAACWDGSLDPVVRVSGDNDAAPDSDVDSDADSDSDSETGPEACGVQTSVVFQWWNGWIMAEDTCDFLYTGLCLPGASECAGCAWTLSGECAVGEVCCVEQDDLQSCETSGGFVLTCGYEGGTICSDVEPEYVAGLEEPECRDGNFCCETY